MIEYRGYSATVRYDPTSASFVGEVDDIPDQVTFHGVSATEIETEMVRAVDSYIDFCLEWGRPTDAAPYSTSQEVRISPELKTLLAEFSAKV